jgi:hypothetical protein
MRHAIQIYKIYVGGIYISLNYVQDGDVTRCFAWSSRDHSVLGLQQTAHYVENRSSPDGLGLRTTCQATSTNSKIRIVTLSIWSLVKGVYDVIKK